MFDDGPEYDYRCPHCGEGYWNEVGMGPFNCRSCGKSLSEDRPPLPPITDDDYAKTSIDLAESLGPETLAHDKYLNKEAAKREIDRRIAVLQELRKLL